MNSPELIKYQLSSDKVYEYINKLGLVNKLHYGSRYFLPMEEVLESDFDVACDNLEYNRQILLKEGFDGIDVVKYKYADAVTKAVYQKVMQSYGVSHKIQVILKEPMQDFTKMWLGITVEEYKKYLCKKKNSRAEIRDWINARLAKA